jgi:hypothetical protein
MFEITCWFCSKAIPVETRLAGYAIKCPHCLAETWAEMPAAIIEPPVRDSLPAPQATNNMTAVPEEVSPIQQVPVGPQGYTQCPFCLEQILAGARKCKHCCEIVDVVLATTGSRHGTAAAATAVNTTVIIYDSRPFDHGLHLLLTVLTCGFWLPVWLLCFAFRSDRR